MLKETIKLPIIDLDWSEWVLWNDILSVTIPKNSGVYEVKSNDSDQRYTIGKASDLDIRIRKQLVKEGKKNHSTGKRIRDAIDRSEIDKSKIKIRWALTTRPSAVEEALHYAHYRKFGSIEGELKFGKIPNYIKNSDSD
jgi:hypothetical protein